MRDLPFPAAVAETLPGTVPTVSTPAPRGVAGHTAAILPHRAAYVATAWRQARAWIGVAYPPDLDSALTELRAKFPALAANVEHLRRVAEAEAAHFEAEPAATPELFQAALRQWEAATLDGLAALASVTPARPVEVSHV
jgi:hypothetical protein